jgi:outer membrane protein TolC
MSTARLIQMQNVKVQRSKEAVKDAITERFPELSVGGNYEKASLIYLFMSMAYLAHLPSTR